ncbi:MAG: hypothetical protein ACUVUQ_03035 [Thermodesulfovibrionales bacterium]
MKNPAASCRVSDIKKLPSFPDPLVIPRFNRGIQRACLIGESRTKELDSLVKPENDTRKPCGKPQGIIKLKGLPRYARNDKLWE